MAEAGMACSFSGFTSLTRLAGLGSSGVPFQEPRTEDHPSRSGCSGRLPSPGCNWIGLPSSSQSIRANLRLVPAYCARDLQTLKKKTPRLTSFLCYCNLM